MLWLFKINFHGFCRFLIHGNSSYVVLYAQCLRYNICSTRFLDIRISTCFRFFISLAFSVLQQLNSRSAFRAVITSSHGLQEDWDKSHLNPTALVDYCYTNTHPLYLRPV